MVSVPALTEGSHRYRSSFRLGASFPRFNRVWSLPWPLPWWAICSGLHWVGGIVLVLLSPPHSPTSSVGVVGFVGFLGGFAPPPFSMARDQVCVNFLFVSLVTFSVFGTRFLRARIWFSNVWVCCLLCDFSMRLLGFPPAFPLTCSLVVFPTRVSMSPSFLHAPVYLCP